MPTKRSARIVLLAIASVLALSGCAQTSKAEQEADEHCPGIAQSFEGKCGSREQDEQTKHTEDVEKEEHEVEGVIKKRQAEETANAIEGITER